jgi:HK97 family phage major capsid protein
MTVNPTDFSTVMNAVELLRSEVEKKSVDKDKVVRIETFLNDQEAKNQELVNKNAAIEAANIELKARLDTFEKLMSRPANTVTGKEEAIQAERKALEQFIRVGVNGMSADELKYFRTDKDSDGGYTTQPEFVRDVIKQLTEISPIRQIATVRSIGRGRLNRPVRTALPTVTREGEGLGATSDTQSTYGLESVPVYRYTAYMDMTIESLSDPDVDLLAEATSDFNEAFAQAEGFDFVKGNAVKRPEGFMTNANVAQVVTGVADQVTVDAVITLTGEVKTGYAPVFTMNRKTVANLRTKKGGDGQYIWNAGNIAAGIPNTLAGYGYVEVPDMDDIAANAFPIAFGDFRRGYMIVDRLSMGFIRDDVTQATSGKVRFVAMKRTGGQVILPEAIKKLKVAVS